MKSLIGKFASNMFYLSMAYFFTLSAVGAFFPFWVVIVAVFVFMLGFVYIEGRMTDTLVRDLEIEVRVASDA